MTVPSVVSSEAPTLNFANPATALSRARRAASTRERLDAANDFLQQRDELTADAFGGRHHLIVIERLWQDAGGHVGDARNSQDVHPHVACGERLRHRRHP